jgi:pimeloyl-ACP methyl ester carboxylesterase
MVFILLAAFALQAGCATPVGVRRLGPREADRRLTTSVLSGDALSSPTLQILNRSGLTETIQSDPAAAIAVLHRGMPTASRSDRLFALAELSFLHAARSGDRAFYLAAALYAYAFLFPQDPAGAPDPFDPRLRTAVDLYNRGLSGGFTEPESRHVVFEQKAYRLPFGELAVRIEPDEFRWGPFRLIDFIDAAEIDVRGLRNDYRWPGIGAALVAGLKHVSGERQREFSMVPSSLKVAATAFLQFENSEDWLSAGRPDARIEARLSLYTTHEGTSVSVGGRTLPLEFKSTSALASALEGSQVYSLELRGLLSGDLALIKKSPRFKDNVFLMAPYRPGRIPLVLVHGTASSPARWAELLNEIVNDPELWSRYQIWLFTYNTGNPILYSGGILAQGLRNVVRELDPEGRDEALRKMVIIGHSQGGMLAKLTVVESGDRFWRQTFKVPPEQLDVSPEARDLLRRSFFFEPLPFVRRVVFIATPHRGSFLVGGWVNELLGRVITLPFMLLSPFQELFQRSPEALTTRTMKNGVPRSIDNMDPGSPFVRAFTALPVAEGVSAHSIIAVDNPEDPEQDWDDGVVAYRSARFDGAASELIVHSGHSVQQAPQTIEEVRRILIENLRQP